MYVFVLLIPVRYSWLHFTMFRDYYVVTGSQVSHCSWLVHCGYCCKIVVSRSVAFAGQQYTVGRCRWPLDCKTLGKIKINKMICCLLGTTVQWLWCRNRDW